MGNTAPRFDTAQLSPLREVVKKLSTMNLPFCDIIQFWNSRCRWALAHRVFGRCRSWLASVRGHLAAR